MINKAACFDKQAAYNSRFKSARDSGNVWDLANAEVYRLASQQWGEIAGSIGPNFDPELHVRQVAARWNRYVETGITWDSLDVAIQAVQAQFIAEDRLRRGVKLIGLDVKLMTCGDEKSIIRKGDDLVVIAKVKDSLHFRVFNSDGRMVVDAAESSLGGKAPRIKALKVQLETLWPPHVLTTGDKGIIEAHLPAIIGHAQIPEPVRKPKPPVAMAKDDPRHHIDPKMVDGILEEMRQLLDIPLMAESAG